MSRAEDLDNANLIHRVEQLEQQVSELLEWHKAATTKRCPVCSQTFTVLDGLFPTHMRHAATGDSVCPMSCGEAR